MQVRYETALFTLRLPLPRRCSWRKELQIAFEAEGSYSFYALATDRVGKAEARLPAALSATFTPVSVAADETPHRFRLVQNYPNPFNPSTTLSYEVASPSRVRMVVYDVLGREIAVLADAERAAGAHSLVWEARGLASGVYFVRMSAEDVGSGRVFNAERTMVLLR